MSSITIQIIIHANNALNNGWKTLKSNKQSVC